MGPLPFVTEVPTDVDIPALQADLVKDGVAVLNPEYASATPELVKVVKDAEAKGVENFKVIVLARNYNPDTSLRDLGTEVAKNIGDGQEITVLVMSPGQVAGYSNQLTRFQIEKGQDGADGRLALNNPPKAAQDFINVANGATFPWTGFTIALILLVAALAGGARVLTRRRSRAVQEARSVAYVGVAETSSDRADRVD